MREEEEAFNFMKFKLFTNYHRKKRRSITWKIRKKKKFSRRKKVDLFLFWVPIFTLPVLVGKTPAEEAKWRKWWRHPERKTKKIVPPEQQQTTFRLILAAPLRWRRLEEELTKVPDSSDRSTVRFFFHWSTIGLRRFTGYPNRYPYGYPVDVH